MKKYFLIFILSLFIFVPKTHAMLSGDTSESFYGFGTYTSPDSVPTFTGYKTMTTGANVVFNGTPNYYALSSGSVTRFTASLSYDPSYYLTLLGRTQLSMQEYIELGSTINIAHVYVCTSSKPASVRTYDSSCNSSCAASTNVKIIDSGLECTFNGNNGKGKVYILNVPLAKIDTTRIDTDDRFFIDTSLDITSGVYGMNLSFIWTRFSPGDGKPLFSEYPTYGVKDPIINENLTSQDNFVNTALNYQLNTQGIENILRAPLRVLDASKTVCTPLSFNIFGQTVSLPCGTTIFWDRPDVQNFRTFWNVLFGGAIVFRFSVKLINLIYKSLDPDHAGLGGVD